MLMRTDPFRDLDRLTPDSCWVLLPQPAVMPMDAWQEGEQFRRRVPIFPAWTRIPSTSMVEPQCVDGARRAAVPANEAEE
ncbi:hypothetical protein [Rhodococcus qingshengii]|uniref:hypothetical protein n=1 Tax=Rhodococcus qingshengii TaxID=334542 RepID=UPI00211EFEEC|nr:hypothetical protein [Rhodococcus qingshengii]